MRTLKDGANENFPKTERAHAWFTAGWFARYDGMELMGTEVAPDAYAERGELELPDLAKQRRSGVYQRVSYDKEGNEKKKNLPVVLKASEKEIQRLTANKISPDTRFHYRLVAGALAMKAAALLPNDSEELADVVNQAGVWVKDRDEKTRQSLLPNHRAAVRKDEHWPGRYRQALVCRSRRPMEQSGAGSVSSSAQGTGARALDELIIRFSRTDGLLFFDRPS